MVTPKFIILSLSLAILSSSALASKYSLQGSSNNAIGSPSDSSSFDRIKALIQAQTYYGDWYTPDKSVPHTFQSTEGLIIFGFAQDTTWNDGETNSDHKFYVHIYDGEYVDHGNLHFSFPPDNSLPTKIADNGTWFYQNMLVKVLTNHYTSETPSCLMNAIVNFIDTRTSEPYNTSATTNPEFLGIQFFISSPDCQYNFATSFATSTDPIFESQFFPYMLALYFFVFLDAAAYLSLYRKIRDEPLSILNVSLGTLYFIATFDLYLFVTHVYSSTSLGDLVTRPLFQGIGIAFAAIVVFFNLPFLMEVKYRISRLQWKEMTEKIDKIGKIGLAFNVLAFILAFESVISQQMLLFYCMFIIFPLPQIIQNFILNKKFRTSPWYFGALVAPKLVYIAYTEAYAFNLFRNTPEEKTCLVLFGIVAVQMLILLIQVRWPRFGIRTPKVYTIKKCPKDANETCPICLEDFKSYRINSSGLEESLLSTDGHLYMVITPCHHEFHLSCLQNWIKQKFECPYCRRGLPLSQELDEDFGNAITVTSL